MKIHTTCVQCNICGKYYPNTTAKNTMPYTRQRPQGRPPRYIHPRPRPPARCPPPPVRCPSRNLHSFCRTTCRHTPSLRTTRCCSPSAVLGASVCATAAATSRRTSCTAWPRAAAQRAGPLSPRRALPSCCASQALSRPGAWTTRASTLPTLWPTASLVR